MIVASVISRPSRSNSDAFSRHPGRRVAGWQGSGTLPRRYVTSNVTIIYIVRVRNIIAVNGHIISDPDG